MNFYENLQVSNWRAQSKYPFTETSTLLLGTHLFPVNWIPSLNLLVTSGQFPLYISRLSFSDGKAVMTVTDNNGSTTCNIIVGPGDSYVQDINGRAAGSIATDARLFPWLKRLIRDTVAGTMQLPSQALTICGEVITCMHFKGYAGIRFNNKVTGPRVLLNFQRNTKVSLNPSSGIDVKLDIFGNYDFQYENTSKLQVVNGVQLKDKTLIIKHRKLSDLRVITQGNNINLTGVTDAS